MEDVKGTAMSIASLFPVEEAEKAVTRMQEVIAEKQKELHQLDLFISDNNNLLKLVQRLPDELSHDVMVPFGKAAFFPGRLIHTNEFLVLLGEGYYTERTSKQTIDILNRRGKLLDAKVDSGKAVLVDLKAEASFFDSTANEAAEGLVEIREDYTEKNPAERMSNLRDSSQLDLLGDPEEAEAANDGDEEYAGIMARLDELEREELAAEGVLESNDYEDTKIEICSSRSRDYFNMVPENSAVPVNKDSEPSSKTRPNSSTAFTGNIVEHTHGLQTSPLGKILTSSQSTKSAPSKPVSRFMMQKGGH